MEESILTSTKKILGLAEDYEAFDLDIITHINTSFSVLHQLGIGPTDGFMITDKTAVWNDFGVSPTWFNMIRTYVYLTVRVAFDPPQAGYLVDLMKNQIDEQVWRLSVYRDEEVA